MIILLSLIAVYFGLLMIVWFTNPDSELAFIRLQMRHTGIYAVVVLAQALFYWFYRRQLRDKKWITLHIFFMYMALLSGPLVRIVGSMIIQSTTDTDLYYEAISVARTARWGLLAAAHLCFIITIVQSLKYKPQQQPANESADILDEFAQ